MRVLKLLLKGAAAGLFGAFAMQQMRSRWNAISAPPDAVFGLDDEADINSVRLLSAIISDRVLTKSEALDIALLLHYGYGAAAGAGYAVLAGRLPATRAGSGAVFGTALWVVGDELPISLSRISDPRSKHAVSHLSAFVAHIVFGVATEAALRGLRR